AAFVGIEQSVKIASYASVFRGGGGEIASLSFNASTMERVISSCSAKIPRISRSYLSDQMVKPSRNFAKLRLPTFEPKRRTPCRHAQTIYLRQRSEDFFRNAITEIGVILFGTQITERQDCDGFLRRFRRRDVGGGSRNPDSVLLQIRRAHDPVSGEIEKPGKNQRHREASG